MNTTRETEPAFKVSYIHLQGYRVSRTFDTREAAQEFIDVNAMIQPLPGVRLEEMPQPVAEMSTPALVREFTDIKCADARGEAFDRARHNRLGDVVTELRNRHVLD